MSRRPRRAAPRARRAGSGRGATGIVVIGHGSRAPRANAELRRAARALAARFPGCVVEACFLEAAQPDIRRGVARCVARGAARVVFLPYFLYLGGHVSRDLPAAVSAARRRHPGVRIVRAAHLGFDARLVDVAADRARRALRARDVAKRVLS